MSGPVRDTELWEATEPRTGSLEPVLQQLQHSWLPLFPQSVFPLDTIAFMLNKVFSATLEKSSNYGGWTYVVWPDSAKFFGTKGLVKITGKIDGHPFSASFMAMGDGQHMLPVKGETRKAIGKDVGDTVQVLIEERR